MRRLAVSVTGVILLVTLLARPARAIELPSVSRMEESCRAGQAESCLAAGAAYADGRGVPQDELKAGTLLLSACELRNADACLQLGLRLEHRQARVPRPTEPRSPGFKELEQQCDAGDQHACSLFGDALLALRDKASFDRAVGFFEKSCAAGDAWGCTELGALTSQGYGVPKDVKRGMELQQKGCDLGDAVACFDLSGPLLAKESGAARDVPRALQLLQRACDLGEMRACSNLGMLQFSGLQGVPADPAKAVTALEKGCSLGAIYACQTLAVAYRDGDSVPADQSRSAGYFIQGCKLGNYLFCLNAAYVLRGDSASTMKTAEPRPGTMVELLLAPPAGEGLRFRVERLPRSAEDRCVIRVRLMKEKTELDQWSGPALNCGTVEGSVTATDSEGSWWIHTGDENERIKLQAFPLSPRVQALFIQHELDNWSAPRPTFVLAAHESKLKVVWSRDMATWMNPKPSYAYHLRATREGGTELVVTEDSPQSEDNDDISSSKADVHVYAWSDAAARLEDQPALFGVRMGEAKAYRDVLELGRFKCDGFSHDWFGTFLWIDGRQFPPLKSDKRFVMAVASSEAQAKDWRKKLRACQRPGKLEIVRLK